MKKSNVFILFVLLTGILVLWFGCFTGKKENVNSATVLDELDSSAGTRLTISCTIIVNGSTWDGNGVEIDATSLPPTSKYLAPSPVFSVTNGTVKNVIFTGKARQPFVLNGNCTVSDITLNITSSDTAIFSNSTPGILTFSNISITMPGGSTFRIKGGSTVTCQNIITNQFILIDQVDALASTYYLDGITMASSMAEVVLNCQNSSDTKVYWRNIITSLPETSWWNGSFQVIPY